MKALYDLAGKTIDISSQEYPVTLTIPSNIASYKKPAITDKAFRSMTIVDEAVQKAYTKSDRTIENVLRKIENNDYIVVRFTASQIAGQSQFVF